MQNTFTIGDLAREFDVTHRTLRFYEDKGLISPRREGQNRIYSRRDRARLKLVILGRKVGFSLAEIKEMLEFYDLKDGHVSQLQLALSRFSQQIATLRRKKSDIEQAIAELDAYDGASSPACCATGRAGQGRFRAKRRNDVRVFSRLPSKFEMQRGRKGDMGSACLAIARPSTMCCSF